MLKELTNLELSKISGGDIVCAACNKELDGDEDIASITPVYNVYTMRKNGNLEQLPDTFFNGEPAFVCYRSKCVNQFIRLQDPFEIDDFYCFINPTRTEANIEVVSSNSVE